MGVFLCWYAYRQFTDEQISEILKYLKNADYFYLILSVFLGFLANVSRGIRWQYPLLAMGFKTKKLNLIFAVFIGYLLNTTIPRSGEVSRALTITNYENIPFEKTFGTIVTERMVDMLILLLFIFSVIFIQFDIINEFVLSKIPFEKLLILSAFLIILVGIFLFLLLKSENKFAKKIKNIVFGLKEGVLSIFKLKQKALFLFHTFFIWLCYFCMFYVCFFALEPTKNIEFNQVLTAFVVGSLAVGFTNGGLGAYPFFVSQILLNFGIDLTIGTALGWISWAGQFLMTLFFGLLSFLILPFFNKK